MELRIIKTEEQYRRYLAEVEALAAHDPDPDSSDGARLELLAKLVEDYEKSEFPFDKPDPIDAILFRMEQQGLRQKDIADMLGGKNRASEILARKRPAELLVARRWVPSTDDAKAWLQRLLAPAGSPAYLKHTLTVGVSKRTNRTNLWLWLARVREIADSRTHLRSRFRSENLSEETIRYLVHLSWMERGPQLAKEFLEEKGIALVIEPHLPNTWLDGAAMLGRHGLPIIGMTLREDRLDNFWFTLVHECIHVWKHLGASGFRAIADEHIEKPDTDTVAIEKEANSLAAEILLPRGEWRRSDAYLNPSIESIHQLAKRLQVHPAIIAGRLRFERQNYTLFTKLVGLHQVRICFPEIRWS